MKENLKVIYQLWVLPHCRRKSWGLLRKRAAQSPASQPAMLRRRADSLHLHRVAMACAESLRPGARAMPTLSHTHSYFISKTQGSVLSTRSDMTKTSAKWAFLAQIAFAATDTRHPSG